MQMKERLLAGSGGARCGWVPSIRSPGAATGRLLEPARSTPPRASKAAAAAAAAALTAAAAAVAAAAVAMEAADVALEVWAAATGGC